MGQSTLLSRLEVYEEKCDDDGGEWEGICDDGKVEEKEGDVEERLYGLSSSTSLNLRESVGEKKVEVEDKGSSFSPLIFLKISSTSQSSSYKYFRGLKVGSKLMTGLT